MVVLPVRNMLSSTAEGTAVLAAFDALKVLDAGPWTAPRLNRAVEKYERARTVFQTDREALERVRVCGGFSTDPDDLILMRNLLDPPVRELWRSPPDLFADNRVALTGDDASTHVALYMIEDIWRSPEQEGIENPGETATRYLSHFGGAPLAVTPDELPPHPLIVQIDFREVTLRDVDVFAQQRTLVGLPVDGILQVFGEGMFDSRTLPEEPGGGVTVRYIDESSLLSSRPVDRDDNVFPRESIAFEQGITYRAAETIDEDAIDRLSALEAATYSFVALYYQTREQMKVESFESSSVGFYPARRVSHLLGAPSVDFALDPQDFVLLDRVLPLQNSDDGHVLLVAIAGTGTLAEAFGDEGWLQVWMRGSDLAAHRFDQIVSFVRSS